MSQQQINLYDADLRRKFKRLTLTNLALAGLVLAVAVGAFGYMGQTKAQRLQAELDALTAQNKTMQEQTAALGAKVASLKADPALQVELAAMRSQLAMRGEVVATLQKSLGPQATSFAEYLRALARQTPGNLWLTGFSATGDGSQMEIRGRMIEASALPDYIRRLNAERAFQGRAFAALQMQAVAATPAAAPPEAARAPAVPTGPGYIEFSLVPKRAEGAPEGGAAGGSRSLPETARELAGVRP